MTFLTCKILCNTKASTATVDTSTHDATAHKWHEVFKYRKISMNIVGMLCCWTCGIASSALLPSYLADYLHPSHRTDGLCACRDRYRRSDGPLCPGES